MKKILSVKRHVNLKRVGMFVIVLALVAGVVVSCVEGEEVKPLQHFKGYQIDIVNMPYIGQPVEVGDKFGNWTTTVGMGMSFANPAEKTYNGVTEGVLDEVCHFMGFGLEDIECKFWDVTVNNQFGTQELTVYGPIGLSVPTGKGSLGEPEGYNCYLSYEVIDPLRLDVHVDLWDQFDPVGIKQNVLVTQAKGFGIPAWMNYNSTLIDIVNEADCSVSYWTYNASASLEKNEIVISNVIGQWTVNVTEQTEAVVSVPSEMVTWSPGEPPLDHFKFYQKDMVTVPYEGEPVQLEDQFGNFTATVGPGWAFGNPVQKAVNEIAAWELWPISHPDYHLMLYELEGLGHTEGPWQVTVDNQFGTQDLTVYGPVGLAVPTKKEGHDWPVGLEYFLCYNVSDCDPAVEVIVDLIDEFTTYPGDNNFVVTDTLLFANPVRITYGGNVIDYDLNDHLVFYKAKSDYVGTGTYTKDISNLFGDYTLTVIEEGEDLLAVPSEKLSFTPLD